MKINLAIGGSNEPLGGYLNIDPYPNNKDYVEGNVANLDGFVETGEATVIRAMNILQYYKGEDSEAVLTHWLSKLSHGGRLVLGFPDVLAITKDIYLERLDIHQANELLYGTTPEIKCGFTLNYLAEYMKTLGYHIVSKKVVEYEAVIVVERK